MQWNPDVATQLIVASDDDRSPTLQMWDLRNSVSPLKEYVGHTKVRRAGGGRGRGLGERAAAAGGWQWRASGLGRQGRRARGDLLLLYRGAQAAATAAAAVAAAAAAAAAVGSRVPTLPPQPRTPITTARTPTHPP
jgi:hypothetical protein